jgi:hypothetical protein
MAKQDTLYQRTSKQNEILDLEQKYFDILEEIVSSDGFTNDLLLIEKEIRENYPKFKDTWNLCILRKLTAGFAEQNGPDAEPAVS